jgi:hypothetical protein
VDTAFDAAASASAPDVSAVQDTRGGQDVAVLSPDLGVTSLVATVVWEAGRQQRRCDLESQDAGVVVKMGTVIAAAAGGGNTRLVVAALGPSQHIRQLRTLPRLLLLRRLHKVPRDRASELHETKSWHSGTTVAALPVDRLAAGVEEDDATKDKNVLVQLEAFDVRKAEDTSFVDLLALALVFVRMRLRVLPAPLVAAQWGQQLLSSTFYPRRWLLLRLICRTTARGLLFHIGYHSSSSVGLAINSSFMLPRHIIRLHVGTTKG